MKYLVTGITGFAGPHLANLLIEERHEVHGLIRGSNGRENDLRDVISDENFENIKWLYGDLKDIRGLYNIFSSFKYDGVFHLAAQSHPPTSFKNPVNTYADNVMGSVNLIDAIQNNQKECRMMFCSTSEVYGDVCKDIGILKEDEHLMPSNPYGASKAAIDIYIRERIKNGFIRGFVTRAFSHTGPRRGQNFSISSDAFQLARMKLGFQDKILSIGNLETKRIVIDVRDAINAYYLLMLKGIDGEAYNVCGTEVHKMQYFTDKLIEISGLENVEKKINPEYYRPIDIQVQIGDSSKLKKITGWSPKIEIERTLEDLFNYWVKKLSN